MTSAHDGGDRRARSEDTQWRSTFHISKRLDLRLFPTRLSSLSHLPSFPLFRASLGLSLSPVPCPLIHHIMSPRQLKWRRGGGGKGEGGSGRRGEVWKGALAEGTTEAQYQTRSRCKRRRVRRGCRFPARLQLQRMTSGERSHLVLHSPYCHEVTLPHYILARKRSDARELVFTFTPALRNALNDTATLWGRHRCTHPRAPATMQDGATLSTVLSLPCGHNVHLRCNSKHILMSLDTNDTTIYQQLRVYDAAGAPSPEWPLPPVTSGFSRDVTRTEKRPKIDCGNRSRSLRYLSEPTGQCQTCGQNISVILCKCSLI